jgi:7-cyano-7-deazaguanine reductase
MNLHDSPLGKKVDYISLNGYNPELLFPLPRDIKRKELGISVKNLPFCGVDIWNHYEVSWLNSNGVPKVAIASIEIPATSDFIIESKSMKLYFNSLNNHHFKNLDDLWATVTLDLSNAVNERVKVVFLPLNTKSLDIETCIGTCVDEIDTDITEYMVNSELLKSESNLKTSETIYSNLLRSNCLITNQPDWATISVEYNGNKINHESFLKYIISYRNHNEFHEQCIERIFIDIMKHCHVDDLTVSGRFTRRGGIDINPIRSTNSNVQIKNLRLIRQ